MGQFARFWKTAPVPLLRSLPPDSDEYSAPAPSQSEVLLLEMQHRISNSLQVVASIAILKARVVQSEEARFQLKDLHQRLMLVARMQRQLCTSGQADEIEFSHYLTELCECLSQSMIADNIVVIGATCPVGFIKSDKVVNLGLIVSELVINALKHGFPDGRKGLIAVAFEWDGADWSLSVSDNGVGKSLSAEAKAHVGLGTRIVSALAQQLNASLEVSVSVCGTTTTLRHNSETIILSLPLRVSSSDNAWATAQNGAGQATG